MPPMRPSAQQHVEWLSLIESSGPFLSVPEVAATTGFRQGLPTADDEAEVRRTLRGYYAQWSENRKRRSPDIALDRAWFAAVTEDALGWEDRILAAGQALPAGLTTTVPEIGETLAPDLVVLDPPTRSPRTVHLLVQRYPASQDLAKVVPDRLWQETPANRMVRLLRDTGKRLGLVTNGEQWLLVNVAPGEPVGFASWYGERWFDEELHFRSFRALLGADRFFEAEDATLAAMLERSKGSQANVTAQLGTQVRQAIELLVAGIDMADRERHGRLLDGIPDEDVYEAAVTVMMRLVFLLFAEDHQPPLIGGDSLYDQFYAVSSLIDQLEVVEQQGGEQILEHRSDAWPRLIATFRLISGGSDHDAMRVPAYGGSLFDPDRFPFLEGREPGTEWETAKASPLPIDNRTVLHMLQAIQFLEIGTGQNRTRQRLSFRALDVEQIGHVYEQLLEHTATRADGFVLALDGKLEPEIPLATLEGWQQKGEAAFLKELKDATGRSERALQKDLAAPIPDDLRPKLRSAMASEGDSGPVDDRVLPFANLIRIDRANRPLVIRPGSLYVTQSSRRSTTGAHYTPRSLTEEIVQHTLEPLIYDGPAEGAPREQWVLKPPAAILDLTVCDPAMGSGAFLVEACRFLAERLVEAWERLEASGVSPLVIAPDGRPAAGVSQGSPDERLLPTDRDERLAIARRLVADHCLYGVDINPLAVNMAKLSLWLVTLQKGRPFTFLDHRLRTGDSLLGVGQIDQLRRFSLAPTRDKANPAFSAVVDRELRQAIEARRRIEAMPANDAVEVERKATVFRDVQRRMEGIRLGADMLTGATLADPKLRDLRRQDAVHRFSIIAGLMPGAESVPFREDHVTSMLAEHRAVADRWLEGKRPFHWPLEFPEVFIDSSTHDAPKGFSAIVGNPPFLGGSKLTGSYGTPYRDYLVSVIAGGKRGNSDLAGYFLLRDASLIRPQGDIGVIMTNTIAQGDTREVGLDQLVAAGFTIPRAVQSRPWPGGGAALEVAHLWIRRGSWNGKAVLDELPVARITPYLTPESRVAGKPYRLAANSGKSFNGSKLDAIGFVLTPEEAQELLARDPRNADVLFPYLNGEDLNSRPDQSPSRWVINFHDWPLEQAMEYPEPFAIVEERVKPQRMAQNDKGGQLYWWRFLRTRPELYRTIAGMDRVLVVTMHTKYVAFSWAPVGQVFSHGLAVIAWKDRPFGNLLNTSFFADWAMSNGSSIGHTLRFTPSDCFETYPTPITVAAETLDIATDRSDAMRDLAVGLTGFYNLFHDPENVLDEVQRFRKTQLNLDNSVAAAYGWDDLDLEHGFHETKQGVRFTISERARREVLDRLLELNHHRYAEEVAQGLHEKGATAKGKARKAAAREKQSSLL